MHTKRAILEKRSLLQVLANKVRLQSVDLRDKNITVEFHEQLQRNFIVTPTLATTRGLDPDIVLEHYPPLFLKKGNCYSLIGHYWVYTLSSIMHEKYECNIKRFSKNAYRTL